VEEEEERGRMGEKVRRRVVAVDLIERLPVS
jgi:hypothetical protein